MSGTKQESGKTNSVVTVKANELLSHSSGVMLAMDSYENMDAEDVAKQFDPPASANSDELYIIPPGLIVPDQPYSGEDGKATVARDYHVIGDDIPVAYNGVMNYLPCFGGVIPYLPKVLKHRSSDSKVLVEFEVNPALLEFLGNDADPTRITRHAVVDASDTPIKVQFDGLVPPEAQVIPLAAYFADRDDPNGLSQEFRDALVKASDESLPLAEREAALAVMSDSFQIFCDYELPGAEVDISYDKLMPQEAIRAIETGEFGGEEEQAVAEYGPSGNIYEFDLQKALRGEYVLNYDWGQGLDDKTPGPNGKTEAETARAVCAAATPPCEDLNGLSPTKEFKELFRRCQQALQAGLKNEDRKKLSLNKVGNFLLAGPAGTGKSEYVGWIAAAFGIPLWQTTLTKGSTLEEWLRNIVPDLDSRSGFSQTEGVITLGCKYGGITFLDEINLPDVGQLQGLASSYLSAPYAISLPGDHSFKIPRHPLNLCFGACNVGYAGTQEMNPATVSRFYVMEIPRMDKEQAIQIIMDSEHVSKKIASFVYKAYDKYHEAVAVSSGEKADGMDSETADGYVTLRGCCRYAGEIRDLPDWFSGNTSAVKAEIKEEAFKHFGKNVQSMLRGKLPDVAKAVAELHMDLPDGEIADIVSELGL